ncbi:DUF4199 domain-containing protein [Flavobacterium sp.]|uniref:DUF4199 domain-containing protein n=1 Tax=Flavobacterium sp. TaxID=239 RepID=UPI002B4B73BC|nr:DUF4199 domain-containing protein [Flavobacterium sp.]HLP65382.1 DUF4199 domain-containing protein [Flavobacterium sp.]
MNEIVKKNGITFGIITGVISILITTLMYTIDLNLFTSVWVGLCLIAFYIIIGVVLLSKTKKELGGVFSFKDAFTTYFISAVVGILISVVFNILLFNFIDPSAKDAIKELSIKSTVEMMEKFDAPSASINETIKKLQESDQFSTIEQLKGSVFSMIFSAVFGIILAAIFKSKPAYKE